MQIHQSLSFEKKVKKLTPAEKKELDHAIRTIIQDPSIGQEKKGDLKGIFVYKFIIKTTQYLLAYRLISDGLELIMIGVHENYYKDLKLYLKKK